MDLHSKSPDLQMPYSSPDRAYADISLYCMAWKQNPYPRSYLRLATSLDSAPMRSAYTHRFLYSW